MNVTDNTRRNIALSCYGASKSESPKVYLEQPSYLEVFWLASSVDRRVGVRVCLDGLDCFDFYYSHQSAQFEVSPYIASGEQHSI